MGDSQKQLEFVVSEEDGLWNVCTVDGDGILHPKDEAIPESELDTIGYCSPDNTLPTQEYIERVREEGREAEAEYCYASGLPKEGDSPLEEIDSIAIFYKRTEGQE